MNESSFLELIDFLEKNLLEMSARITALEVLTKLLSLQAPRMDVLISGLQVHLESIEQDDSQADYASALRELCESLTEAFHELKSSD